MAEKTPLEELGASAQLMQLIDAKHGTPPAQIPELPETDLDLLRRLVGNEIDDPARVKAIAILARIDPEGTCELLAEVLHDDSADKGLRAVAAVAVSRCRPRERVQEILLHALAMTKSRLLQSKIAKSLGRIGDPEAMGALRALGRSKAGVAEQANLALTLIQARFQRPQEAPPLEPSRGELRGGEGMAPVTMEPLGSGEIEEILHAFDDSFHGIEVDREVAFQIRIGKDVQPLLLNRQVMAGGGLQAATEKPSLLGFLALRSPEAGTYCVDHLICSDPASRERARLSLFTTSGQPSYAGEVERSGGSLRFELADAEASEGFPLRLVAMLTPGRVEVESGMVQTRFERKRLQPQPMPLNAVGGPT